MSRKSGEDATKGDHWVLGKGKRHIVVSNPWKIKNKIIIIIIIII